MHPRFEQRLGLLLVAAAAHVWMGAGCGGAPLGGSKGTGGDAPPCTTYGGCNTGEGGTAGSNAALCGQIDSAYASALAAAYACTPGAPDQCQALVATVPMECPEFWLRTTGVRERQHAARGGAGELDRACDAETVPTRAPSTPAIPPQAPAVCVPDGPGAATGSCVAGAAADGGIGPDGGNGVICAQLAEKYSATLSTAAACTPGAPNQCQAIVANVPELSQHAVRQAD